MQKVASAGPIAKPDAKIASWIELARSKVILPAAATSGTSDFLAVEPPGATTARRIPMPINAGSVSSQNPEKIGIMSEVRTVSSSDQLAMFLRPSLSITDPRTGESSSPGIAVKDTTKPAAVEVPVISSAIHGIAIKTIEPEITLVSDASWSKTNGARLRFTKDLLR
jgi:hypothetical protein